jgi:hypothetical protein
MFEINIMNLVEVRSSLEAHNSERRHETQPTLKTARASCSAPGCDSIEKIIETSGVNVVFRRVALGSSACDGMSTIQQVKQCEKW